MQPASEGAGVEQADLGATTRRVDALEFVLRGTDDLDQLTRATLDHLAGLPGVTGAGLGLTEGAGRRLRFTSADRLTGADLAWCHIDAYDDVPLTMVARTGEQVLGSFDALGRRYADFLSHRRELGNCALAALPLPGTASPVGGLILYFDHEPDFTAGLGEVYATAARRIADAVRRVRTAAQGADDDPATIVAEGSFRATLALEADPRAAGAARRFLRDRFEAWQVDDDLSDTAQLCLSELVTNVIMHARTSSRLTMTLEDRQVMVMLRDVGGAGTTGQEPAHRPVDDADEFRVFGRGLTLVDALADDWGSHRDENGTTAWFVCRLPAPADDVVRTG